MTGTQTPDPREAHRAAYETFRDGFGDGLLSAARAAEQAGAPRARRRRVFAIAAPIAVAAIAVLAFVTVPKPVGDGALGTPDAAAAVVRQLQATLDRGVLVREAENTQTTDNTERFEQTDWTDLATRDQRVRTKRSGADSEFWNRGPHERWFTDPTWNDDEGRQVIKHMVDTSSGNASASESPLEEVARLLRLAERGELSLRTSGDEQTVELVERCYADYDHHFMDCPEDGKGWPDHPPGGTKPVHAFQTWTLTRGSQPRILTYENGTVAVGSHERRVAFHTRYRRWEVLPPTEENLALVAPPVTSSTQVVVEDKQSPTR